MNIIPIGPIFTAADPLLGGVAGDAICAGAVGKIIKRGVGVEGLEANRCVGPGGFVAGRAGGLLAGVHIGDSGEVLVLNAGSLDPAVLKNKDGHRKAEKRPNLIHPSR